MSSSVFGPPGAPVAALVAFLVFYVIQRLGELAISSHNTRLLLARGAREYGGEHLPMIIVLHTLFPLALVAEVLLLGVRPGALTPLWAGLFVAAQGLRWTAMRALGERWSTRVLVLPGVPLVRHGPYRWLRHPNYLAVVIELLAAPLVFGAWRTAAAFSAANLLALWVRIRCEERALAGAGIAPHST
jgi:methyltransferase